MRAGVAWRFPDDDESANLFPEMSDDEETYYSDASAARLAAARKRWLSLPTEVRIREFFDDTDSESDDDTVVGSSNNDSSSTLEYVEI